MLTDKQIQKIRPRFSIFRRKIYLSSCSRAPYQMPCRLALRTTSRVGTSKGPLVVLQSKDSNLLVQKLAESDIVASNRQDGLRISFHVYNTIDDVNAVAEVLRKNIDLLVLGPSHVGSYD